MPVVPRGNSYQATVHHQGERIRKSFRTKSEAEAWELQTKAALLRGGIVSEAPNPVKGNPQTMMQLFELTYQRYWKNSNAEKSSRINGLKIVSSLGENTPPSLIDEARVDDLIFTFEVEGISDSTINRRLSALSKMLTFAHERGYIKRKPKIERKKEPQGRIRYLTEQEEKTMLDYFKHIHQPLMHDLVAVGLDTGMRLGEIQRLKARDLSEGLVSIWKAKNNKPRSIPLTDRAREILEKRAFMFPEGTLFEDWTHSRIRHYWDTARRHMGLMRDPQFVPHAMRHTFCSRLVQRGVDILTVCKLAGHSSVNVTMRYAHLAPHNLSNAIKALEAIKGNAEDVNPQHHPTPRHSGTTLATATKSL